MEILGVVGQNGAGDFRFPGDGVFRNPGLPVLGQFPGSVLVYRTLVLAEEAAEGLLARFKRDRLPDIAVPVVEKIGDFLGGVGSQ